MQVVDNAGAAQVEEVLAHTAVAGTITLPVPDMGQGMLRRDALAQPGPPRGRQLALAQLLQQAFIRVDGHAASTFTGGAAVAQRSRGALFPTDVNHTYGLELPYYAAR